jgi:hypothetical protein
MGLPYTRSHSAVVPAASLVRMCRLFSNEAHRTSGGVPSSHNTGGACALGQDVPQMSSEAENLRIANQYLAKCKAFGNGAPCVCTCGGIYGQMPPQAEGAALTPT